MERDIYITDFDLKRLMELLRVGGTSRVKDGEYFHSLEQELNRAHTVEPHEIPQAVVTMNSMVRLKEVQSGEEQVYTLVFPTDADIGKNKISVLAPIGTAMLGYRVGDTIEWPVPVGMKTLRVEEILYQPEAAGDFHL